MQLNSQQREQLFNALLNAFDHSRLKQMVYFKLGEDLDSIAAGNRDRRDVVFELLKWAEAQGKVLQLIEAARETVADNAPLQAIAQRLLAESKTTQALEKRRPQFPDTCHTLLPTENPAWIADTRQKIDAAIESLGQHGSSESNLLVKELLQEFRKALTPPRRPTLVDAIATFRQALETENIEIDPDEIWGDVRDRTPAPEQPRW